MPGFGRLKVPDTFFWAKPCIGVIPTKRRPWFDEPGVLGSPRSAPALWRHHCACRRQLRGSRRRNVWLARPERGGQDDAPVDPVVLARTHLGSCLSDGASALVQGQEAAPPHRHRAAGTGAVRGTDGTREPVVLRRALWH